MISRFYNIFRSDTEGGPYKAAQHIATVDGDTFTYTDTGLDAGIYYYVIKAEDEDGDESNASPEATATIAACV